MKNKHEVESIEVKLLKMIEQHEITEDDYNLITKYLKKVKNDLKKQQRNLLFLAMPKQKVTGVLLIS